MSSPIEILNEKIDTDKEILSVMPKNTKKNAELYVKKVTEIKEGYQKYLEEVITEIKRRAHKINSIKESPEIKQVEKELKKLRRQEKLDLIEIHNPEWIDLYYELIG